MSKNISDYIQTALLIGIVAWLAYTSSQPKVDPNPQPKPVPVVTVESVVKEVHPSQAKGFASSFDAAADKVEAKEIKWSRELLEFVKPLTTAARVEANKPFDALIEANIPNGEFAGKEAEVAAFLRKVAKAWTK
jgi:hypothetical protein